MLHREDSSLFEHSRLVRSFFSRGCDFRISHLRNAVRGAGVTRFYGFFRRFARSLTLRGSRKDDAPDAPRRSVKAGREKRRDNGDGDRIASCNSKLFQ